MSKSKGIKESDADLISSMPDPILHFILSRLPTTVEAVRTSILSRRWRYLWTSVSYINITSSQKSHKNFNKNQFEEFVCRVLEISSLDLDSFCFCCTIDYNMSIVGRWIEATVRRNVKLLDLTFCIEDNDNGIELPQCLVTCGSLEVLRLWLMGSRISFPKFTNFLALRVLELDGCKLLSYDLVNNFLKSLTLLEELSLIDCETYGLDNFNISCPKLENLRIDNRFIQDSFDMEYGIEGMCNHLEICCPKLVFLEFGCFMANEIVFGSLDSLRKAVIHPQDEFEWSGKGLLDLFVGISHVEYLSLRIGLIGEDINLKNILISLPNLKTMELSTTFDDTDNMDALIQILTSSPNLESLHVIIVKDFSSSFSPAEDDDLDFFKEMKCTLEQLKMVKVTGVSSLPDDVGFIKFLLESTPFLETMSITTHANMADEDLKILTCVSTLQRASPEAEIIFVQDQV